MKFFIETERLILRSMLPTDLEGMFELDSNPIVHRYLGNKPVKSIGESKKIIDGVLEQYEVRGIGRWSVIEKSSGDFIGWSGLKLNTEETLNNVSNFYDIGYRLIPRYWGKGYATESGKAALEYAFNTMRLKTVYGITEKGNQASHRVLLKLGLLYIEDFFYEKEQLQLRWYKIENQ
ncbi:GNAT family N-acetyltransferase [Snuella sedimenti]|uniref:GNAT family N-acetyltransferase n=1 Tax=Snuella sedimenti TaxID=2798802 RepID=A0A8J7IRX3_9FLAO|nr:GNAT family N-acetyltransferase [Snuella sedimenti]MBJ6366755.1 GNAT family N-acetyltransferase [Snuella sedimenti]